MTETEQPPPPPPPAATPENDKAGAGPRVLAVLAALALLFIAAVAVLAMILIGDTTPCADVDSPADLNEDGECFDGSSTKKLIALVLGWPGAILLSLSVLAGLAFAITGRGGRRFVGAAVIGAVLFGLSILAGSI